MDSKRNRYAFGIGTIGRDMVFNFVGGYFLYYLTDVLHVGTGALWWITAVILFVRIFDALACPVMGLVVDNTHTRYGKFKPWIAFGAAFCGLLTLLIFSDLRLPDAQFAVFFSLVYFLWSAAFLSNDIPFWSMLPTLSVHQAEREKIGSFARICANIGSYFVMAGIIPLTLFFGRVTGSLRRGYFAFALLTVAVMWAGQCVMLIGVKEPALVTQKSERTSFKEMIRIICQNDQLFFTAISMALYMIGSCTTGGLMLYFYKYAYGNESMYTVAAIILGISQNAAIAVFPLVSGKVERKKLYSASIFLIISGYLVFFFAPTHTMLFIGAASMLLYVGMAFIQILMLMFVADSVDYGHWKLHKRNDSVSFSLQPFIIKMGGALSGGIVSAVVIVSGIKDAATAADVTAGGLMIMKTAMLVFPPVCILAGFLLLQRKFKLDKETHTRIMHDLRARGDIAYEE